MNSKNKIKMLHDVLDDEELDALRHTALARGLDALRHRQRRRRRLQVLAVAVPLLVLLGRWRFQPAPHPAALASATLPAPRGETGNIKYITKDELFALFPHRPIALIGGPGQQRFLLLDELPRTETQ